MYKSDLTAPRELGISEEKQIVYEKAIHTCHRVSLQQCEKQTALRNTPEMLHTEDAKTDPSAILFSPLDWLEAKGSLGYP